MSKVAERLIILKDVGDGCLQRLASAKRFLASPQKSGLFTDPALKKVNEALLKKFPEIDGTVEKTQGWEILSNATKAKQFFEETDPIYNSLIDSMEFTRAAAVALGEIAGSIVDMKLDDNPMLTANFLDLLTIYAQVNLLISTIEERKLIVAAYFKLYQIIKCTNETNYQRLAVWINTFSDPIKAMQEELKGLSSSLGKTLVNLLPTYSKLRNVSVMRKEGVFNITLKPEEMTKPVIDKFHFHVLHSERMYLWIIFGYLLVPETFALPGAFDLCKLALSESFVVPLIHNVTIQIHGDFDNLFSNYKSKTVNLSKQKKLIKDVLLEAVGKAPAKHKERRTYLRQELTSLLRLFRDEPGLLGPKFQLLLGGLALAKEEVLWYFRHLKAPIPKAYPKKVTEDDLRDTKISELIYLIDSLTNLVRTHRNIVETYHSEYLRGTHYRKLSEQCNSNFLSGVGTGIAQISKSIIDDIRDAAPGKIFHAARLNWFRAEASLSSMQAPTQLAKVKGAVDRFTLVLQHTRTLDELDNMLDEYASLRELWYHKDPLAESMVRAIKDGPNQPLHAVSFLRLFAEFPSNANKYNPEDLNEIGAQSVQMVEKLINEIGLRLVSLINEISKNFMHFDEQLSDINAAHRLLATRKDYRPPKDFVAPIQPGTESEYRRRPEQENLRLYERNAFQLCTALNQVAEVRVFDTAFAPREFIREKIEEAFRKYVRANAVVEVMDEKHHVERIIQRPTILEHRINAYISALKLVENLIDINIGELLQEVFISETYITPLGRAGNLDWVNVEETDIKYNGSLIGYYVNWYGDFVAKRVATPGIVYSPSRKSFISRTGLAFKAELYSDLVELKSLVTIVGPYGVKLIDREVLKFILANVNAIKDYVAHNRLMLDELSKVYPNEIAAGEALRKLKDADGFLTKSIAIGNALCFRELLHEALRWVVEDRVPHIYNTVQSSFNEYRRNTFRNKDFIPIDSLASDCGIPVGTADQALKEFFSKAVGSADAPLLDLLPFMFAASFTSSVWRDAQFKPVIEAHSNNAHTLAKTINCLIVAFKAINTTNSEEKEIANSLKTFVEVSAVLLLRMARNAKQDKNTPIDLPSVLVFMDMFIKESPLLTRDVLEGVMPYALLRNEWKQIFSSRVTKKENVTQDSF